MYDVTSERTRAAGPRGSRGALSLARRAAAGGHLPQRCARPRRGRPGRLRLAVRVRPHGVHARGMGVAGLLGVTHPRGRSRRGRRRGQAHRSRPANPSTPSTGSCAPTASSSGCTTPRPWCAAATRPRVWQGLIQDVTERKDAERALRDRRGTLPHARGTAARGDLHRRGRRDRDRRVREPAVRAPHRLLPRRARRRPGIVDAHDPPRRSRPRDRGVEPHERDRRGLRHRAPHRPQGRPHRVGARPRDPRARARRHQRLAGRAHRHHRSQAAPRTRCPAATASSRPPGTRPKRFLRAPSWRDVHRRRARRASDRQARPRARSCSRTSRTPRACTWRLRHAWLADDAPATLDREPSAPYAYGDEYARWVEELGNGRRDPRTRRRRCPRASGT